MDRIYKYNPNVSYEPNGGRYLQLITAEDLYIQNKLWQNTTAVIVIVFKLNFQTFSRIIRLVQ